MVQEYNNAAQLCTALIRLKTPLAPQLQIQLFYLHLISGNLPQAEQTFSSLSKTEQTSLPGVFRALSQNEHEKAQSLLDSLPQDDLEVINAQAITHLSSGALSKAGEALTKAPNQPSLFYNSEPLISNLITLSELLPVNQGKGWSKERMLTEAARWSEDGAKSVQGAFKL